MEQMIKNQKKHKSILKFSRTKNKNIRKLVLVNSIFRISLLPIDMQLCLAGDSSRAACPELGSVMTLLLPLLTVVTFPPVLTTLSTTVGHNIRYSACRRQFLGEQDQ